MCGGTGTVHPSPGSAAPPPRRYPGYGPYHPTVVLPWQTEDFSQAWGRWIEFKAQEKGFRFKRDTTEQAALARLQRITDDSELLAIAVIDDCIAQGYPRAPYRSRTETQGKWIKASAPRLLPFKRVQRMTRFNTGHRGGFRPRRRLKIIWLRMHLERRYPLYIARTWLYRIVGTLFKGLAMHLDINADPPKLEALAKSLHRRTWTASHRRLDLVSPQRKPGAVRRLLREAGLARLDGNVAQVRRGTHGLSESRPQGS